MLRSIALSLFWASARLDGAGQAGGPSMDDEVTQTRHLVPKPRPVEPGPHAAAQAPTNALQDCRALDPPGLAGAAHLNARARRLVELAGATDATQVAQLANDPGVKDVLTRLAPGGDLKNWNETSNKQLQALGRACEDLWLGAAPASGRAGAAMGATGTGVGWQTAVVDGLASFVATRTEAELSLWVMQHFTTRLCTARSAASRKSWFPAACALVEGSEGGEVPGSAFISALRADIEQLPYSILRELMIDQGASEGAANSITDAVRALGGAIFAMREGEEPAALLAGLAGIPALQQQCARLANEADLFGCSLAVMGEVMALVRREAPTGVGWPSNLTQDSELQRNLTSLYGHGRADLQLVEELVQPVAAFVQWTYEHPPASGDASARLQYARLLTAQVSKLVEAVIAAVYSRPPATVEQALIGLKSAEAMLRGDYGEGVRSLAALIDRLLAVVPDEKASRETRNWRAALTTLRRYVVLSADLAAAKDSAEVQAAIQAAAAPVGGWRIKREGFTMSLSALAGIHFGGEFVPNKDRGVTISPLAAVGIDLSGPFGRRGSTFGAFFSVLDLGQLVSARLYSKVQGEEKAKVASEVKLVSVLSPGAYLKFGIGRSPFTIGGGVAYAPALRGFQEDPSVGSGVAESGPLAAIRVGLFLAVDVTIFPFVHVPRGLKKNRRGR